MEYYANLMERKQRMMKIFIDLFGFQKEKKLIQVRTIKKISIIYE